MGTHTYIPTSRMKTISRNQAHARFKKEVDEEPPNLEPANLSILSSENDQLIRRGEAV